MAYPCVLQCTGYVSDKCMDCVQEVCQSSISCRMFIQQVVEELTCQSPGAPGNVNKDGEQEKQDEEPCQRKACKTRMCNNNGTMDPCAQCKKPLCGKGAVKKCPGC